MSVNAEESSFRYNARSVFLTYPNCNLPMQTMLEELTKIKAIKHYIIATELHESGEPHLHCVLRYSTPISTRNNRYFDINNFHPNIQKPQDLENCVNYCKKDGNFITNWPETKEWGDILKESNTAEEFFNLVKINQPKDYVINHERLEYFAAKHFERPISPFKPPFELKEWKLPDDIKNWLSGEFPKKGLI